MTLRRFVTGAPELTAEPEPSPEPVAERCGMCDAPVEEQHGHVVDRHEQRLVCTCRGCHLLFTGEWNGGRFRAVPDRYLTDPRHPITPAAWEQLQVPVGIAFFILGVAGKDVAAFYPSPAGATECLLDLAAWNRLVTEVPLAARVEPEVEALLVRRSGDDIQCYLVPVDVCYALVGAMRINWRGFDGGAEAKAYIDEFFDGLAQRAGDYVL
jgi:hypothetical protein